MTEADLRAAIARLRRVPLGALPTPLEECKRLPQALDGPPIFIKRDDLTGLALGGNKVRHWELRLAHLLAQGHDSVVYASGRLSNQARITAAACGKAGLPCTLILPEKDASQIQGNVLLDHLLGAHIVPATTEDPQAEAKALVERLRREGHNPFLMEDWGAARFFGAVSYLEATLEMAQQLRERGIEATHVYMVSGSSMTGIALGVKLLGLLWQVTGVNIAHRPWMRERIVQWSQETARHLGLPLSLSPKDVLLDEAHVGEGYGIPSAEGIEAIKLAARTEGVILDPVYTGKAMACLIHHIRQGSLTASDTVVFIHTGGVPLVFPYAQELTADLIAQQPVTTTSLGRPPK